MSLSSSVIRFRSSLFSLSRTEISAARPIGPSASGAAMDTVVLRLVVFACVLFGVEWGGQQWTVAKCQRNSYGIVLLERRSPDAGCCVAAERADCSFSLLSSMAFWCASIARLTVDIHIDFSFLRPSKRLGHRSGSHLFLTVTLNTPSAVLTISKPVSTSAHYQLPGG